MTTQERIQVVEALRAQVSQQMDERAFALFDLALCGHMTTQQQERFIQDARTRGLLGSVV